MDKYALEGQAWWFDIPRVTVIRDWKNELFYSKKIEIIQAILKEMLSQFMNPTQVPTKLC